MFKRSIFAVLTALLILIGATPAQALQISGGGRFPLNYHGLLGDVTVVVDNNDYSITAAKGMALILPPAQWSLWEKDTLTAQISGNAVERGKMAATVDLSYSADLKTITIPVKANLTIGDEMIISGLWVRIYDRGTSPQFLGLDLNGDGVKELDTSISIRIDETVTQNDQTPAYPPTNFQANVLQDPWRVKLSWQESVDYDLVGFDLQRTVVRRNSVDYIFSNSAFIDFTDDLDLRDGDRMEYRLYAVDKYQNRTEPVILSVVIPDSITPPPGAGNGGDSSPPQADQNDTRANDTGDLSAQEQSLLERLFNYYQIRYQIKCLPSGKPAKPNDSACLWAKIDLIYAQTRLNRSDVASSLSVNDLRLMALRLPFSQDRYQTNCAAGVTAPAPYCPSLDRAIQRASTLLNQ